LPKIKILPENVRIFFCTAEGAEVADEKRFIIKNKNLSEYVESAYSAVNNNLFGSGLSGLWSGILFIILEFYFNLFLVDRRISPPSTRLIPTPVGNTKPTD
jgi:hypothetical protein